MPVKLSIKNAPDEVVQRLRDRAERNHRSLQGELMAIIEAAAREDRLAGPAAGLAQVRHLVCKRRPSPLRSRGRTAMGVKVIDASAVAALLFGEPEAEAIAARLGGARLVAPTLPSFELANVCLTKSRRDPNQCGALAAAFRRRPALGVEKVEVDHDGALALAMATSLTTYEATFVA